MTLLKNAYGQEIVEFSDRGGEIGIIKKSSLACTDAIWFGNVKNTLLLTQDQVEDLLPILTKFVETGEIS